MSIKNPIIIDFYHGDYGPTLIIITEELEELVFIYYLSTEFRSKLL